MTSENFYGLPELPFNLHLGLTFERESPGAPATLRLPRRPSNLDADDTMHRAAVYTLGEVAAAVSVLDSLVDALPVFLLTMGGRFRQLGPVRSGVHSLAAVDDAPPDVAAALQRKRKLPMTGEVSLFDEDDRLVAQMRVSFHARALTERLQAAFLGEGGR